MAISEIISGIVFNVFSSWLYDSGSSIAYTISLRRFKKELNEWIQEYIIRNDGSILCSGDFERFISHFKPIEKMLEVISGEGEPVTKDRLIDEQLSSFFENYRAKTESPNERSCVKIFLSSLYDEINGFYFSILPQKDKYILGKMISSSESIIDAVIEGDNSIVTAIENNTALTTEKMDALIEMVSKATTITDPEVILKIYSTFARTIMDGKADEVNDIFPLISGKSKTLELSITYLIGLMSNINVRKIGFDEVQRDIDDDRIYADLAQKFIFMAFLRNDVDSLKIITDRNSELHEITGCLIDENLDSFYSLEVKRDKQSPVYYCYTILNNYPDHQWLINRICLISIFKQPVLNATQVVEVFKGINDSIIDKVLIFERKATELCNILPSSVKERALNLIEEICSIKDCVKQLPIDIQCKYYCSAIRTGLLISIEEASKIINEVPDKIKNNGDIEMLCMQLEIENGIADLDKLMDICMKNGQYWLFNNYLVSFVNEQPLEVKMILEERRFVINKEPVLFLLYVQLVNNIDGKDSATTLLQSYEETYGIYLEFWIEKLRIDYSDDILLNVTEQWIENKWQKLTNYGNEELIKLIVAHNRYPEALRCIAIIEETNNVTPEIMRCKALALLNTKHEIEAYNLFVRLFNNGLESDEVIHYILQLAIYNNRIVPDEVLERAKLSQNAPLLAYAAQYLETKDEHDDAYNLILRALLINKQQEPRIYGLYIGIRTRKDVAEEKNIKCVDAGVTVYLRNECENIEKVYCIHSKNILPYEPYVWENAEHIYRDTAITIGLMRKKEKDLVNIGGKQFQIVRIAPVDSFFFNVCINKMVESGSATHIEAPVDESGHIDVEYFKAQLISALGDESDPLWYTQYKDLSAMPVSFYLCTRYTKLTYTKLIELFIQDVTIPYREYAKYSSSQNTGYVLSTSALVVLKNINYNPTSRNQRIIVPKSLQRGISNDADYIISENNRENVASVKKEKEDVVFISSSEEEKQNNMAAAIELKHYSEGFESKENNRDLENLDEIQIDLKDFLGIADYDALLLAQDNGLSLVSAEIPLTALAISEEIGVNGVCIADFLADTCSHWSELFDYTAALIKYRFAIPFTCRTTEYLSAKYTELSEEERELMIERWIEILDAILSDLSYGKLLITLCRSIFTEIKCDRENINPIYWWLMFHIVKYIEMNSKQTQ